MLSAPRTFAELTDDAGIAADLADLYGDIEKVDLMVGLFAEKRPTGFAFSDTAFRIFILMASRRLNSDRFFTKDFRPEVYSPTGLDWIRDNDMRTVLLRHMPELRPALRSIVELHRLQPMSVAQIRAVYSSGARRGASAFA